MLQANPDWLIVVEGVDKVGDDQYWWGGNLMGAKDNPVRLSQPDQLVYSAHDYGPGVYRQGWFDAPNFPENMPDLWTKHWAYLNQTDTAPVLLGEFGGRSMDPEEHRGCLAAQAVQLPQGARHELHVLVVEPELG